MQKSGIGFCGLLTLVFVIAKLGGWIDWSWWLVFTPLIAGIVVSLIILAVIIIIAWKAS